MFGIKVTRLCFAFSRFTVQVTSGRFVFATSRVRETVNGARRVFFRNVRRVSVHLRSKARATIIVLLRLCTRESRPVLKGQYRATSDSFRFVATSFRGHFSPYQRAIAMHVNGLTFRFRVARVKSSYRLFTLQGLYAGLVVGGNGSDFSKEACLHVLGHALRLHRALARSVRVGFLRLRLYNNRFLFVFGLLLGLFMFRLNGVVT